MTKADLDLLGEFIRDQSQDAFTALVQRHLGVATGHNQVGEAVLSWIVQANLGFTPSSLTPIMEKNSHASS
jgi:hypothetical protein